MKLSSRHSVLFNNADDVGKHLSYNDTHIKVLGDLGIAAQSRWTWNFENLDAQGGEGVRRITWRASRPDKESANSSAVIKPVLSPGFNVYTNKNFDRKNYSNMVNTPLYNSFHSNNLSDLTNWLPHGYDISFISWDGLNCDYDITLREKSFEISQWCPFRASQIMEITKEEHFDQLEVGLFYIDIKDDQDVNLAGLRCSWDDQSMIEKCQKTMLMYMPAHMREDIPSLVELEKPVGLHPKVTINLEEHSSTDIRCDYFVYLQLPVGLFIDKFQSAPICIFGQQDLEEPEYKLKEGPWGSESLFILEAGKINEITLNSRYVSPSSEGSYKSITFDSTVFKACDTGTDKVAKNPFYAKNLGYEAFFTPDTVFHHINSTSIHVGIPHPDMSQYNNTQYLTLGCIIFSLIYLISKIFTSK